MLGKLIGKLGICLKPIYSETKKVSEIYSIEWGIHISDLKPPYWETQFNWHTYTCGVQMISAFESVERCQTNSLV